MTGLMVCALLLGFQPPYRSAFTNRVKADVGWRRLG